MRAVQFDLSEMKNLRMRDNYLLIIDKIII